MVAKAKTAKAKRETKTAGRETKRPKRVTMTGPGTAVAHEPVQVGEMVSHQPPTPQMLVQAGHNAGTLCGYRQALDACSKNLRRQAQEIRKSVALVTIRSGFAGAAKFIHGKAQAELLEVCAAAIEAQYAARAAEEQSHARAAEALLATAH